MKTKIFIFSLFLGLIYMACEDSLNTIGMGIQPDGDKIGVFDTTIHISASTVKVDSIYAKSIYGYLGEFYDPSYGSIKSGYICQFYPGKFKDSIVDDRIDSIKLVVYYKSWIGDSLAPMEASIFPVVNALDKHYYTNMDPAKYCDLMHPVAKQGYTARNMNLSDSLFKVYRTNNYELGMSVSLPQSLGQQLYDEFRKPAPNAYSTLEDFVKFFPGFYLTTTYGSGSLLTVEATEIYAYYNRLLTTKDIGGNDSTYTVLDAATFAVTKEIIQLNSFKNAHDENLLVPNDTKTYLKTPSGVFTKVVIPIPEIVKSVGKKKFSSVKLSIAAYPKEDEQYLGFPGDPRISVAVAGEKLRGQLLLISPDSLKTFFEEQRAPNSKTNFVTTFNSNTYTYDFNNIANVVQNAIKESEGKELKNLELLLIPVTTQYYTSSSSVIDYATSHYLRPSAVTLKKGGDNLKIQIVATDLEGNGGN